MNAYCLVSRSEAEKCCGTFCTHQIPYNVLTENISITLFTAFGDVLNHLTAELTAANLTRIFPVCAQHLPVHNAVLSTHMHVMSAKVILNLIEIEVQKDIHQNAAYILTMLLEACVDKLDSHVSVQAERISKATNDKEAASEFVDFPAIEKSRPLVKPGYATEKLEDHVGGMSVFSFQCSFAHLQ